MCEELFFMCWHWISILYHLICKFWYQTWYTKKGIRTSLEMTCSKGPRGGIEPGATAARTQPLYMEGCALQQSYQFHFIQHFLADNDPFLCFADCCISKNTSLHMVILPFIYISCKHSTLNMDVSVVKGMFHLYKTQNVNSWQP